MSNTYFDYQFMLYGYEFLYFFVNDFPCGLFKPFEIYCKRSAKSIDGLGLAITNYAVLKCKKIRKGNPL